MIRACRARFTGSSRWASIKNPTVSKPSSRAAAKCWTETSASVQCVAIRATVAPRLVRLAQVLYGADTRQQQHRDPGLLGLFDGGGDQSEQDGQDRPGYVEAAVPQPDQQRADQSGVLRRPFDQGQRVFGPVDPNAEPTTHRWSAKCTPSIMIATRSSQDRSAASRSASACSVIATNLRDTADLSIAVASRPTCSPTGSSAAG